MKSQRHQLILLVILILLFHHSFRNLVGESFDIAQNRGAEQYYQYAILKGGQAKGWVKIVEVF